MNEPFTFKRCFLLCLPALVLGLWLRALVIYGTPEALLSADTNSYWDGVSHFWNDGKFSIPEKRRWLYPLLLMGAPALPGNTPQAVALVQHALGLFAIVGIGWIAGQLTRWHLVVVPLATLLFAASPRGLVYEHQIIADSALTNVFILACAVALPLRGITQRRLAWTLALCAVVLALKPHGKPLALPILAAAACFAGVLRRWHWANWSLLAFCGALFFSSGSSRQAGWLLLSSTLPFVPLAEGAPYPQYRRALEPVIREARALGDAYPWQQSRYKKLLSNSDSYDELTAGQSFAEAGPEWNPLTRRKKEFARVTANLGQLGLETDPMNWLRFTFLKIARGFADPEVDQLATFRPAVFWEEQRVRNEERWLQRTNAIQLIYELDRPDYEDFVQRRVARAAPDLSPIPRMVARLRWFIDDLAAARVHWTWIGVLGMLGLAASLRCLNALPVLAAFACSLLTSYGIGDTVPRYVYPVEWLLYLLPLLGIAGLLDGALALKRNLRSSSH